MDITQKKEIDSLMKDVPASFIPIKSPATEQPQIKPDPNKVNIQSWGAKSNEMLADYKFGEALAKFGDNEANTRKFFKRFATAICASISNEYQKRGVGAESLKAHYDILYACMDLLAKEIETKGLQDYDISSIIASLHGFITNYTHKQE
jgi:hypothetical protein